MRRTQRERQGEGKEGREINEGGDEDGVKEKSAGSVPFARYAQANTNHV